MIQKASILENIKYGDTNPVINTLLNTEDTKEVRIVFKEHQLMKEHKAPYPIIVEIVEGMIDFGVGTERFILKRGMIIALKANVVHELKALENSVVRLSLNKSDSVERPQKALK